MNGLSVQYYCSATTKDKVTMDTGEKTVCMAMFITINYQKSMPINSHEVSVKLLKSCAFCLLSCWTALASYDQTFL